MTFTREFSDTLPQEWENLPGECWMRFSSWFPKAYMKRNQREGIHDQGQTTCTYITHTRTHRHAQGLIIIWPQGRQRTGNTEGAWWHRCHDVLISSVSACHFRQTTHCARNEQTMTGYVVLTVHTICTESSKKIQKSNKFTSICFHVELEFKFLPLTHSATLVY